jgi:beta-glucosidase
MDGEEVIQLYVSSENTTMKSPIRALKGFKRIALKAGESKTIQFELSPQDLSIIDDKGIMKQPKGKLIISIGGGQPDTKIKTMSNVVKGEIRIG